MGYQRMKLLGTLSAYRILRHVASLSFDMSMAGGSFLMAYLTVYGYPLVLNVPALDEKLLGLLLSYAVAFGVFKPYRGSWRYTSVPDLMTIIKATFLAVTIYTVGAFLFNRADNVPRSVPILTLVFSVVSLVGARLCYRIFVERTSRLQRRVGSKGRAMRNVLLCGFSDKAESFIRATRRDAESSFLILGILDDSYLNCGRTIQGVKVLGSIDELENIVTKLKQMGNVVDELVVTENSPARRRLAHIVECANSLSLKVSRIPDPTNMKTLSRNVLIEPRPIELGDLLERPEVNTDLGRMARLITGRIVLITGAGGSIGSELSRQVAVLGPSRLIISDSSEFYLYTLDKELREAHPDLEITTRLIDVRNRARVSHVFGQFTPEVVFHAAALKHVPMMEDNPLEAANTNVLGTRNVADAALANGTATFVMISTDKAVNPTNIMGATKRAAEAYCQALDVSSDHTRFKTVRFGNVLGSNGSVVPRFQEQIAAGGPVTVTHPQIVRFFMTIPEAVRLVLRASSFGEGERGKIMVLDMGKPIRIADLAERMIQLAGFKPRVDIDIVFTGLRPGEKLFEELFDPVETLDGRTEDGFVIASPRIIDKRLVDRTLSELSACVEREDAARAIELLAHIVPEYNGSPTLKESRAP